MWANSCFLIKQERISAERACGEPGILQPSTFLLLLSPPREPLLQPGPIHEFGAMGTRAQAPSAGSAGRGGSRDNQEAGSRAPPAPLGATKPLGGAGGEILTHPFHLPSSFPQPSQLPPAPSYQETARCAQTRASRHQELSRFLDLGQGFSKKQTLTAEPLLAKHRAPSSPRCKPSLLPGVGHL